MENTSAEQARRQAAEARRQKILARQKDRLSSITGVYAQSPGAGCRANARTDKVDLSMEACLSLHTLVMLLCCGCIRLFQLVQ
jgi:hypothetical protein